MLLWAATLSPSLLTADQRQAIADALQRAQQDDGGWNTASMGSWKRADGSALDTRSDGYATGLATFALKGCGTGVEACGSGVAASRHADATRRGLAWLASHQDPATGAWFASSLNKQRDPASDAGKFMSDAATAYAVLALTTAR